MGSSLSCFSCHQGELSRRPNCRTETRMPPNASHRGTEETPSCAVREENIGPVKLKSSTQAGSTSAPAKPCRITLNETTDICPKESAADIEDVIVITFDAESVTVLTAGESEYDVDATGKVGQGEVADSSTDDEKAAKKTTVKEIENSNNRILNDDVTVIETAVSTENILNPPPWTEKRSDTTASLELTPDSDSSTEKAWDSIVSNEKPTANEKTLNPTTKTQTTTVNGTAVPGDLGPKPPPKPKAKLKYTVSWGDIEPEKPKAPVGDLIDSPGCEEVREPRVVITDLNTIIIEVSGCYAWSSVTIRVMFRKRASNRQDTALAPS